MKGVKWDKQWLERADKHVYWIFFSQTKNRDIINFFQIYELELLRWFSINLDMFCDRFQITLRDFSLARWTICLVTHCPMSYWVFIYFFLVLKPCIILINLASDKYIYYAFRIDYKNPLTYIQTDRLLLL